MATPWILMGAGLLVLVIWFDRFNSFIKHAILFLCFDYNKNSANQYDKYWPIKYFFVSALYFFIFAVYFFSSGFEDISHVIFLSWFGVMFIRLLHFIRGSYNTCKLLGGLLFTTFIPFGILLEIGLLAFKNYVIVWGGMIVYIVFSIMFILSILFTEILLVFFIEYFKGEKNMKEKQMRTLNSFVKLGFIVLVIGIILISLGKTSFFGYISCYELGLWFGSLSLAIIALGYALDSDKKMKDISNMNFLEALSDFEFTRMRFINPPNQYSIGTFLWRSLSDVERMAQLDRTQIKDKHQNKFINYFCASLEDLFRSTTWEQLNEGFQQQVIKMFITILKYQRLSTETDRLNSITHQMGRPDNESIEKFIERLTVVLALTSYNP